jgi:hypothetical protein
MTELLQGTEQTCAILADEIIARLDRTYDLVYVDYRSELSAEQLAALVRGDFETLWESLDDYESESRYDSCQQIIDNLMSDVLADWEDATGVDFDYLRDAFWGSEQWDRVRFAIEERDNGDWMRQLCSNTGRALLRITAIDEDHGYAFEEVAPERVLEAVGFPVTETNVAIMRATLAECSPEFSVLMGYWIVGADVEEIYKLSDEPDTLLEIINPHLYLGNPFAGSGFISERPLKGSVTVKRSELCTDRDAFGYAVDEIYGGLSPSDFEATIRPAGEEV